MTRVQTTAGLVQVNEDGTASWAYDIQYRDERNESKIGQVFTLLTDRELSLFRELMETKKQLQETSYEMNAAFENWRKEQND
jgi:hypothetical protein